MAANDKLTISELHAVQDALWDARAKWEDIGRRIGVDNGTLAAINHPGDPDKSFTKMLSHWLKGVYNSKLPNSKPRTWRTLIEVLRTKVVGEEEMANQLEKEKYPVPPSHPPPASQPAPISGGQPPVNPGVYFGHNKGQTIQATIVTIGGDATLQLPGHPPPNTRRLATDSDQDTRRLATDSDQDTRRLATDSDQDTRRLATDSDQEIKPLAKRIHAGKMRDEINPLAIKVHAGKMCHDISEPITESNKELLPPEQMNFHDIHTCQQLNGFGVEIAILDTGIYFEHDVFQGKVIDGYDFVEETDQEHIRKSAWKKPGLHGTAVAAIAAGNQYKKYLQKTGTGMSKHYYAGIAPQAKLYICRISDGSYTWNPVIKALDHLIEKKTEDPDRIDIAVMSFGSEYEDPGYEVQSKLEDLASKGVILIAAGGNKGAWQSDNWFPASSKHVISVGAFNECGRKVDFTTDYAEVYAPGHDIIVPSIQSNTDVCKQSGTSFAAPMVAGFLALLLQCVQEHYPSKNVQKMFHDDEFLRHLFKHYTVVNTTHKTLVRGKQFLTDLRKFPEIIVERIRDKHPLFKP